jgi:predicted membrane-bound mannosyltransferase
MMAVVMIAGTMMMVPVMTVVAMVPVAMPAAIGLRQAFVQRKFLAHTDLVFAHV